MCIVVRARLCIFCICGYNFGNRARRLRQTYGITDYTVRDMPPWAERASLCSKWVAMATVPPTKTSGLVRTRNVSKSSVGKANYVDGTVVGATAHSNDITGVGTGATLPIRAQCGAVGVRLLVFLRCRARVKNGTRKER